MGTIDFVLVACAAVDVNVAGAVFWFVSFVVTDADADADADAVDVGPSSPFALVEFNNSRSLLLLIL